MSRPRATCLACGFEGNAPLDERDRRAEVSMTLIEYEDPIPVDVVLVREFKEPARTGYATPTLDYRQVAGRYGAETRCTDVDACSRRQHLMAAPEAPRPDAVAVPAASTWFDA